MSYGANCRTPQSERRAWKHCDRCGVISAGGAWSTIFLKIIVPPPPLTGAYVGCCVTAYINLLAFVFGFVQRIRIIYRACCGNQYRGIFRAHDDRWHMVQYESTYSSCVAFLWCCGYIPGVWFWKVCTCRNDIYRHIRSSTCFLFARLPEWYRQFYQILMRNCELKCHK